MLKSFFKDSLIYSINTFLSRGIGFLLIPLYTSRLLPADYGIIDIFIVFSSFVFIVIPLEISQSVARFFPSIKSLKLKQSYASTAMWFTVTVFCIFEIILFLFEDFANNIITGRVASIVTFRLAVLNIGVSGLFYFFQEQLRWTYKIKQYSIVSLCYTLVTFGVCAYLIVVQDQKINGYFIGMITGGFTLTLLSIYFNHEVYRITIYQKALRRMLGYSIPLVFSSIAVVLSMYVDRVLVSKLMGLSELGIFGVAVRFASITSLIMTGFQSALVPLIYKNYNESTAPADIAKIFRYFLLFSFVLCCFLVSFSKEMIVVLTNPNYYDAWSIIPIIAISNVLSIMYIFIPGLSIAKKTAIIAYINIGGAILNIILNFALIPFWGIHGAALSTLITYFILFLLNYHFSQKYYMIPFDKGLIVKVCVALIVYAILINMGERYFWNTTTVNWGSVIIKSLGMIAILYFGLKNVIIQNQWYKKLLFKK